MSSVNLPGLSQFVAQICETRNLPRTAVSEALREALKKGYEKYRKSQRRDLFETMEDLDYFANFEVELDIDAESFRVLAIKTIVETVTDTDHEIALADVRLVAPEAEAGAQVVVDVSPEQAEFGRLAAIQTKQVLSQKLRDQQRRMIQEEFQDQQGTVIQGRVLRLERNSVVLAITSTVGTEVEAELPRREQLPNDRYAVGAVFKVFLKQVADTNRRGAQLVASRADAGLVVYLFANEVPEIEDDIVRIVAIAREANPPGRTGPRTKIAVDTVERDVDPVGACIGARGSRIQAVVSELRGEKLDVIRWSPDPSTYIANALSPARVTEVRLVDPDIQQAHVLVANDQLSLAIGKEGQNVRLAARLTGWKLDIKDADVYYEAEAAGDVMYTPTPPSEKELAEARRRQAEADALEVLAELEAEDDLNEVPVDEFDFDSDFAIA